MVEGTNVDAPAALRHSLYGLASQNGSTHADASVRC